MRDHGWYRWQDKPVVVWIALMKERNRTRRFMWYMSRCLLVRLDLENGYLSAYQSPGDLFSQHLNTPWTKFTWREKRPTAAARIRKKATESPYFLKASEGRRRGSVCTCHETLRESSCSGPDPGNGALNRERGETGAKPRTGGDPSRCANS